MHCAVAVSEDLGCALVIPVVDDVLHQVGIASHWNGLKEVPADDLATVGHASALEQSGGPGGHVRKVEENAAHPSVRLENGRNHEAVSAGNVHQSVDLGKVVCGDHSLRLQGAD